MGCPHTLRACCRPGLHAVPVHDVATGCVEVLCGLACVQHGGLAPCASIEVHLIMYECADTSCCCSLPGTWT